MPLTPDVAGELGRYLTMLQQHLSGLHNEQSSVKAQLVRSRITDELKNKLGASACAALGDCLPVLDTQDLVRRLASLEDKERAMREAIRLVEGRLA